MNHHNIITNITHKILNTNNNLLYTKHNSIFDYIFKTLDLNIFTYGDIAAYYYDLIITNDFMSYHNTTQKLGLSNHVNNLLFFHDGPPPSFKKEDIALFNQETTKVYKVFFNTNIADTWRAIPNKYVDIINYGIPHVQIDNINRQKSIIILNLDKNPQADMLYRYLKNQSIQCDIMQNLDDASITIIDIAYLLSNYKICINLSTQINTLFAASCGCQCVSPYGLRDNELLISQYDYSNIIPVLNTILLNDMSEDTRQIYANRIKETYDYNTFYNYLTKKLYTMKQEEAFIL
jgi:hypothetical protein